MIEVREGGADTFTFKFKTRSLATTYIYCIPVHILGIHKKGTLSYLCAG